ncbi:MAG TPA: CGNR zinc finger domain-containing protein [Streptosporangiaceae bacterium]|nr:CGNR zinc finger domain-containing protein [Streptosporangiaceae bacterium]
MGPAGLGRDGQNVVVAGHAAFLGTSKNRSRSWCSMQVRGNRTKTRAPSGHAAEGTPPKGRTRAPLT